jgi:hypothetical protein
MRSSVKASIAECGFFKSAKSACPIPTSSPLIRRALVQLALDPDVISIDFVGSVMVGDVEVRIDAIVVERDRKLRLDVVEHMEAKDIDEAGLVLVAFDRLALPALTITAADLGREPRASNADLVWSCRNVFVGPGDRVRILQLLTESGPLPLIEASSAARACADPIAAVLAMVCDSSLEMDLGRAPVGPETPVRRRPA